MGCAAGCGAQGNGPESTGRRLIGSEAPCTGLPVMKWHRPLLFPQAGQSLTYRMHGIQAIGANLGRRGAAEIALNPSPTIS